MRDRPLILGGLVVFLGLVTVPIWYNLAAGTTPRGPQPKLATGATACVATREWMRTSHMDLLLDWRREAVRAQDRTFVARDGRTYAKSLTGTCLSCHASKVDFCDRCHAYAGVAPACWDCHVDGKDARALARRGPP